MLRAAGHSRRDRRHLGPAACSWTCISSPPGAHQRIAVFTFSFRLPPFAFVLPSSSCCLRAFTLPMRAEPPGDAETGTEDAPGADPSRRNGYAGRDASPQKWVRFTAKDRHCDRIATVFVRRRNRYALPLRGSSRGRMTPGYPAYCLSSAVFPAESGSPGGFPTYTPTPLRRGAEMGTLLGNPSPQNWVRRWMMCCCRPSDYRCLPWSRAQKRVRIAPRASRGTNAKVRTRYPYTCGWARYVYVYGTRGDLLPRRNGYASPHQGVFEDAETGTVVDVAPWTSPSAEFGTPQKQVRQAIFGP